MCYQTKSTRCATPGGGTYGRSTRSWGAHRSGGPDPGVPLAALLLLAILGAMLYQLTHEHSIFVGDARIGRFTVSALSSVYETV